MSDLTRKEKQALEYALAMESGYVLHFSNRTFAEFFEEDFGINIYSDKYSLYGDSKAKRMRAFWEKEDNALVGEVLNLLLNNNPSDKCYQIVRRLRESSDYKLIDGRLVPIHGEEDAKEVEQAVKSLPYPNARGHLKKAVKLFADRPDPDYANSIKESISAVESLSRELTDERDFSVAVRKLNLHGAFTEALIKMYGYTSDEAGIRHARTNESLPPDQATARYMLVICSAVVNFIADKTTD
ncbi:MAG: hypothetical protein ACR2PV_08695 [Gammaproteobacteria bacterium]